MGRVPKKIGKVWSFATVFSLGLECMLGRVLQKRGCFVFAPGNSKTLVLERTYCYECVCIESPQEIQTLRKQAIKPPELLLARQKQMCHFSKYLRTTKKCHLPSALVSESKIKTWK